jgi:hypothetical protein
MTSINFREASFRKKPIRDLQLSIAGTRMERLIDIFIAELDAVGIVKLRPTFYFSTEWGVSFGTTNIGIPFYLAHPDLVALHADQVGHIEGQSDAAILQYFRHEMGHVVNYGYKLYEQEDWIETFGSITQPYLEEYRPQPFSTRFVRHLPGWYAQKHPDEDWAETFAVWMTPSAGEAKPAWRATYAAWPAALAKLEYCDRKMASLRGVDPLVRTTEHDEDVREINYSVDDYYLNFAPATIEIPPGLDGALRAMFEDFGEPELASPEIPRRPAAHLISRLERRLVADVFRWTGHFPEQTRLLVRHFARRAEEMQQVYPESCELELTIAFTTLVTSLATTHVHRGSYLA